MPLKDKVKRAEYEKAYRQAHKEKCREYKRNWRKNNPEKSRKMDQLQRLKFPWKKNFDHAKQRCTNPNHHGYKYYGAKGITFSLTMKEIKELWFRDKAYLMDRPSIDRKDTYGNYTFKNCRFLEFEENNRRLKRKKIREDK